VTISGGFDGTTPTTRVCKPRRVLLMHSGAFAKFVGRLDVTVTDDPDTIEQTWSKPQGWYDPVNGFEVIAHQQAIIPIDKTVPEDRYMAQMLEPYQQALQNVGNLDELVGYAPGVVKRTAPSGADSQLGNLVSTSMWLRLGVQTDFAMTNTTGIRADLPQGPVNVSQLFNVFPFDNSITKMILSSSELTEMFDFVARRSQSRACVSQVQIAGAHVVMDCGGCDPRYRPDVLDPTQACVEQIFIGFDQKSCNSDSDCSSDPAAAREACDKNVHLCRSAMVKGATYELATNNYLAGGGSGFRVLQRNTTQLDTKIQQRDAVMDLVRQGRPCGWQNDASSPTGGGLLTCTTDAECAGLGNYVCACPENVGLDRDGDGLADEDDACPDLYATTPNGCPTGATPGPLGDPDAASHVGGSTLTCVSRGSCTSGAGRCVLTSCRQDVAASENVDECTGAVGMGLENCRKRACTHGGEQCKVLACLDASVGATVDARIVMLGR
jgi:5'-nucleotidase